MHHRTLEELRRYRRLPAVAVGLMYRHSSFLVVVAVAAAAATTEAADDHRCNSTTHFRQQSQQRPELSQPQAEEMGSSNSAYCDRNKKGASTSSLVNPSAT